MFDKILRITGITALYLCTSLFLAQILLLGYLAYAWKIDRVKWNRIVALAQGYDILQAQEEINKAVEERVAKLTSDEVLELRAKRLRGEEFEKDKQGQGTDLLLSEGREIDAKLKTLAEQKANFESRLTELEKKMRDEGLLLETQLIEKLPAEMGKKALLAILKEPGGLERVIMILKAMEANPRRKILAEMEPDEELAELVKVLQKIGDGYPIAKLIEEAKKTLPKP